jgi:2-keto-myo-inositol isomerase
MEHPFRGLALHTWTLDTTRLEDALEAARQGGFDAVELRRVDFRRCFERGLSNAQVLELVRAAGLPVSAVGPEYGWLFASGEESARLFSVFRDTCENAAALNCGLLMSALGPGAGSLEDAVVSVRKAGDLAAEFGLRLALEFQFQHPIVRSLETLRDIIARAEEIFYVQYSDVPDAPPSGTPPTDRLPPGEGVVRWTELFQLLAEKHYAGYLSYEAPNPVQWERSPHAVAKEGVAATRTLLAQAFQRSVA